MKQKHIYTDGSCLKNPGAGGWAVAHENEFGEKIVISGHEPHTTNNRMELIAVIRALEFFGESFKNDDIVIASDSKYVVNGATTWMHSWQASGWSVDKKNLDLWKMLYVYTELLDNVRFEWVKAHNGHPMNSLVDHMARREASTIKDSPPS